MGAVRRTPGCRRTWESHERGATNAIQETDCGATRVTIAPAGGTGRTDDPVRRELASLGESYVCGPVTGCGEPLKRLSAARAHRPAAE
jgi:hypothetical protein